MAKQRRTKLTNFQVVVRLRLLHLLGHDHLVGGLIDMCLFSPVWKMIGWLFDYLIFLRWVITTKQMILLMKGEPPSHEVQGKLLIQVFGIHLAAGVLNPYLPIFHQFCGADMLQDPMNLTVKYPAGSHSLQTRQWLISVSPVTHHRSRVFAWRLGDFYAQQCTTDRHWKHWSRRCSRLAAAESLCLGRGSQGKRKPCAGDLERPWWLMTVDDGCWRLMAEDDGWWRLTAVDVADGLWIFLHRDVLETICMSNTWYLKIGFLYVAIWRIMLEMSE